MEIQFKNMISHLSNQNHHLKKNQEDLELERCLLKEDLSLQQSIYHGLISPYTNANANFSNIIGNLRDACIINSQQIKKLKEESSEVTSSMVYHTPCANQRNKKNKQNTHTQYYFTLFFFHFFCHQLLFQKLILIFQQKHYYEQEKLLF